jgi:hypothetical protein
MITTKGGEPLFQVIINKNIFNVGEDTSLFDVTGQMKGFKGSSSFTVQALPQDHRIDLILRLQASHNAINNEPTSGPMDMQRKIEVLLEVVRGFFKETTMYLIDTVEDMDNLINQKRDEKQEPKWRSVKFDAMASILQDLLTDGTGTKAIEHNAE